MASSSDLPSDQQTFEVRRAPRLGVFLALGAVLGGIVGVLVAALLHFLPAVPPMDPFTGFPLDFGTTAGMALVVFGVLGMVVFCLIWLLMDRRSQRTRATYTVQATNDPAQADLRLHRTELAQWDQRWTRTAADGHADGSDAVGPEDTADTPSAGQTAAAGATRKDTQQ